MNKGNVSELVSKSDNRIVEWLGTRGKSTSKVYWNAIKSFAEFTGWTAEQMLDEREKEYDLRPRERGKVSAKVEEYFKWLIEEKGKADVTAKAYCGGIASFYKRFNMRLTLDWRNNFQGTPKAENVTEKMSARQVEKYIAFAPTLRDKALMWCGFQGLMDISTALSLNCSHIADEIGKPPMGALLIKPLRRKKEKGRRFDTFIYKTAIRYLKLYLQERFGEKWLDVVRDKDNYDEPLFVSRRGNRQDRQYVNDMMRQIAPQSDIANSRFYKADMNPLRFHSLRASGSSLLRNDDMDKTLVKYLMGHRVEYDGAYIDGKDRTTYVRHAERVLEPKTVETTRELEERLKAQGDEIWELKGQIKQLRDGIGELVYDVIHIQRDNLKHMGLPQEEIEKILKGYDKELLSWTFRKRKQT